MCHPISEFNEELEVFRRRGTTIRAEQLRMPIFVDKSKSMSQNCRQGHSKKTYVQLENIWRSLGLYCKCR